MKNLLLIFLLVVLSFASCATRKNVREIAVETLVKSTESWDGSPLPAYGDGQPEITVLRITIPPGQSLNMHKHLCINTGYLLKGELTVMTETNQTMRLQAGETVVELVNSWHYGKNTGKKSAEIVVFYAGTVGQPITVLKEN